MRPVPLHVWSILVSSRSWSPAPCLQSWLNAWCEEFAPNAGCDTTRPPTFWPGLGLRPEIAKKANFMKGKGCNHCNKKGYRGRMGIYELMTMTPQVREMAFKGESTQNVRRLARKQGMRTLFEDGIDQGDPRASRRLTRSCASPSARCCPRRSAPKKGVSAGSAAGPRASRVRRRQCRLAA